MSSFDQVIKNILSDLFGSNEQEDVIRPKPRPSGLGAPTTSLRPRSRPEQDDDDEVAIPSGTESTSKFISSMADFDDTPEEGVDIPLSTLQTDARNLNGKYKTTAMQLAKLNKGAPLTDGGRANVKVAGIEEDTTVQDLLSEIEMVMDPLSSIRPRARPKSVAEIQAIEKEQRRGYTELDSTKDLQVALNAAGITVNGKSLVEDGIMGNNTRKAIRSFQEREGLKVDGIAGPNTKQALRSVAPDSPITVEVLDTKTDQDTTESEGLMTRPSVAREGQISGEGALDQFASSSAPITSERLLDAFVNESGEDVDTPKVGSTRSMLMGMGVLPKLTGALVSSEVTDEVQNLNPVEKVKALGYIKGQYRDFFTNPSFKKIGNIVADIRDGRYGGYTTNLDEDNPADAKTIEQFFKNAIGKNAKFDAQEEAWCALFVDSILNEMGADRLGTGGDKYDRVRARAYEKYGDAVLGKSPTEKEFNAASKQGDIVVLHSSFVATKPDGDKEWFSIRNVKKDASGNYTWVGDPSDDIMQAEVAKMNDGTYRVANQYHVGFNMGKTKNGMLQILGGNQNDSVNVRGDAYPPEAIMAVRRITSDTIDQEIN